METAEKIVTGPQGTDQFGLQFLDPGAQVQEVLASQTSEVSGSSRSEVSPTTFQLVRPPKHVIVRPLQPSRSHFRLLQFWEGRVTGMSKSEFVAILSDRTHPDYPEEEVVIDLEEVPLDDHSLVKPGAVFYWSIGYADHPGRPRVKESRIRFRRLPKWTQTELDRAKKRAIHLTAFLTGD